MLILLLMFVLGHWPGSNHAFAEVDVELFNIYDY